MVANVAYFSYFQEELFWHMANDVIGMDMSISLVLKHFDEEFLRICHEMITVST